MEIKKEIKRDSFAVRITLLENEQTIGWAHIFIKFQDRHNEPYAYLENMYVEPGFQSKGYGTKIVQLAIEEAKKQGCYKIIGTSKHHKTRVHEFYEKNGFVKYGYAFRRDLISNTVTKTADGKEQWTAIPEHKNL